LLDFVTITNRTGQQPVVCGRLSVAVAVTPFSTEVVSLTKALLYEGKSLGYSSDRVLEIYTEYPQVSG
jgi:hypothetical protein